MSYKIGNYIHAELKDSKGEESVIVQGTIKDILLDGTLLLPDNLKVQPSLYNITVFSDVTSLNPKQAAERAEAMRRHPAGKGITL